MSEQTGKPVRFLIGEKVYLRPIGLDDTDLYFRMLFHPDVRRLTGTQANFTREQIHRYIEGKSQDTSTVLLLIARKDTDEVIGDVALQDIHRNNRSANIRIAIIGEENQGKGYGSEALRLMLDYGFGICNLHRIELNVFSYNERAIHVYEKLGFQREGVQRDALYYDHRYHDSIIMSMLEDEYRAKYKNQTP
jgi:RimJ/RimL family protein N-acetyltransferase